MMPWWQKLINSKKIHIGNTIPILGNKIREKFYYIIDYLLFVFWHSFWKMLFAL